MGRFKVVRGKNGLREIEQQPTADELKLHAEKRSEGDDLEAALNAEDAAAHVLTIEGGDDVPDDDLDEIVAVAGPPPPISPEGQAAFDDLRAGVLENNVQWAKARIVKLERAAHVAETHALEATNEKPAGGRKGVMNALEERKGELALPNAVPGLARHPAKEGTDGSEAPALVTGHAPASGLPCEHCDFTAGSAEGLAGHVSAHHPETLEQEL